MVTSSTEECNCKVHTEQRRKKLIEVNYILRRWMVDPWKDLEGVWIPDENHPSQEEYDDLLEWETGIRYPVTDWRFHDTPEFQAVSEFFYSHSFYGKAHLRYCKCGVGWKRKMKKSSNKGVSVRVPLYPSVSL